MKKWRAQLLRALYWGALFIGLLIIHAKNLDTHFLSWDDTSYVTKNRLVTASTFESGEWVTEHPLGEWIPFTTLVNRLLYKTFGAAPEAFHWASLLLHLANGLLLWQLLAGFGLSPKILSVTVAIFLFHPLQVEAVAWIAAKKDLLVGFFILSTLLLFQRALDAKRQDVWQTLIITGSAAAAMLSKNSAVVLPGLLLAVGSAKIGWRRLWREQKVVIILVSLLSLLSIWIALPLAQENLHPINFAWWQRTGATLGLWSKIYLRNFFMADHLYPLYDEAIWSVHWLWLATTSLLTVAIGYLLKVLKLERPLKSILAVAIILMLPYVGLLPVSIAVADRYLYLALLFPALLMAACLEEIHKKWSPWGSAVALLLIGFWGWQSWQQVQAWSQPAHLWQYNLRAYPESVRLQSLLADELLLKGDLSQGLALTKNILALHPDNDKIRYDQAVIYYQMGRHALATEDFQRLIEKTNYSAWSAYYLAKIAEAQGDLNTARRWIDEATKKDPKQASFANDAGVIYAKSRRFEAAKASWERALKLEPHHQNAAQNLRELQKVQAH